MYAPGELDMGEMEVIAPQTQAPIERGVTNTVMDIGAGMAREAGASIRGGFRQIGSSIYGAIDPRTTAADEFQQVTDQENAWARQRRADYAARGLPGDVIRGGGMLAAGVATSPTVRTATWLGAIGKNALAGAAGESTLFDADAESIADKGGEALFTAAITGGVSALASPMSAGGNFLARRVEKANKNNPRPRQVGAVAEEITPLSLGQLTGIPYIRSLESRAYNSKSVKFYANQAQELVLQYIKRMANSVGGSKREVGEGIVTAKALTESAVSDLDDSARALWKTGEGEAIKKGQLSPERIPVTNTQKALQAVINDTFNGVWKQLKEDPSSDLSDILTEIGALSQKGGLTVGEYSALLKRTEDFSNSVERLVVQGKVAEGSADRISAIFREAAAQDAQAVKAFAQTSGGRMAKPLAEALDTLEETRHAYKINRDIARATQGSAVHILFGKNGPATPEGVYAQFMNFTPEAQRTTINWLNHNAPQIVKGMQNKAVNDAVKAARAIKPSADAPIDLHSFTEALFGEKAVSRELWTAAQRKDLLKMEAALESVMNIRPGFRNAGTPVMGEDIAPNIMSLNPIFIARQVARVLQGEKAADFLIDPAVYKRLLEIQNTSGPTQWAARAGLSAYLNSNYVE